MDDPTVEFTRLTGLRPEALGEPGERTFRILVDGDHSSAVIWLEKEQLLQLALGINQMLASLSQEEKAPREELAETAPRPPSHMEFKVGKMVLGHDGASERLLIDAHDVESGEDSEPAVRIWGDRPRFREFAEESLHVCAAGRPICQLCGRPIDRSGHGCARMNGHGPIDLSDL